jgi:hypothetical protein
MYMQLRRLRLALAATLTTTLIAGMLAMARADDTVGQRFICRAIAIGETPNAQMTADSSTQLVCRPVQIQLKMSGGSLRTIGHATAKSAPDGPDLSHALTPEQVNDAYVKFIDQEFHIDHNS